MEFELWYLLLVPVLFGAGWFSRSFDIKEKKSVADETQTLYKGLDLLLDNKKDQALNSLVNLAKIDPDTVELHFALGTLYRKRGDYDRAVKIHNHLYNRADLSKKERARALFSLGQDYLKAGLWDRAEDSFRKTADLESDYKVRAIKELVNIYESEKEWLKAIDEAHILEKVTGETYPSRISHLYCELTLQCMFFKKFDEAAHYLQQAIHADPNNKRALIMQGTMLQKQGKLDEAVEVWKQVGKISPEYETLVVASVADTLLKAGKDADAVRYLESVAEKGINSDSVDAAVDWICKIEGPEKALEFLRRYLSQKKSLIGFKRLTDLRLAQDPDNKELKELSDFLKNQIDKTVRYKCNKCGFVTKSFQWQCPGCRNWDSFAPVRSEDPSRI